MPAPTNAELAARVRQQNDAIMDLIDIALTVVRESGDSSVTTLHALTRLNRIRQRLSAPAGVPMPQGASASLRH